MRTTRVLDALIPRTRQAVLGTLLLNPDRGWYVRQLARHLGLHPSSVQGELTLLTRVGILQRTKEGKHVYYRADANCPVVPDLRRLMVKTAGLVDVLRDALEPLKSDIDVAFVFGSVARAEELSESDVDLMIIGRVKLAKLARALSEPRRRLSRVINPTTVPAEEFNSKAATGHGVIRSILRGPKLFVIGGEDELEAVVGRAARRSAIGRKDRAR